MLEWLEWARGPVFRACFIIMLLGLLRVVILNGVTLYLMIRQAKKNKREIKYGDLVRETLTWLFPVKKAAEQRIIFSLTSIIFHLAIIITPLFLSAHILLWERGLGLSRFALNARVALNAQVADYLTLLAIVAGLAIFVQRVGAEASRGLSRFQDYFLPLLIIIPFFSGYLAMHPALNPFSYNGIMFVHVMSGNLIFLLIPFSKISHVALFPMTQLMSALGWYLNPDSGRNVMLTLGKENEPI
ncbi:respiratory nitrate reductase subunit gamma [candidate division CSSED10-310 bacterium]|uniref:Respiratory nitrate reductase subunit gamma n=1 Tax=candidate division CSSED10-310 bacterium TaxID=2855610 RepID=A0ABV6Z0Y9_UNCC1